MGVNVDVIEERTGESYVSYLESLISFIDKHLTKRLLNQDLNPLLKQDELDKVLPNIKDSIIVFLEDEVFRVKGE
jgi:hypothetical protein